ncbi:MarR family transcriptional regulator [Agromyces sp. MMS17-SY077]|uniref:MarR family transcriptional regulator n=2 Tax=Agromyces seonyuensis TaxID=2662446 RepID=A0A6I4P162_9MICO|nr:MarR family transcriptional regulator [Agromyces seonyuensis]MWB97759.1 MarR family transcriptional regulator [Agromyces seonyuensis]
MVAAARAVVAAYKPVLEPLGLTHPQYLVMLALWESSPRPMSEIAGAIRLEPATATPLVKRLEQAGLVRRARRAGDERVVEVGLTDAGAALRERALDVPPTMLERLGMTAGDVEALRATLADFTVRIGTASAH